MKRKSIASHEIEDSHSVRATPNLPRGSSEAIYTKERGIANPFSLAAIQYRPSLGLIFSSSSNKGRIRVFNLHSVRACSVLHLAWTPRSVNRNLIFQRRTGSGGIAYWTWLIYFYFTGVEGILVRAPQRTRGAERSFIHQSRDVDCTHVECLAQSSLRLLATDSELPISISF